METYWYCGVHIPNIAMPYHYISDQGEIELGSYVEVPFGENNVKRIGRVDMCAEYTAKNAPYPVDRTKHIIRFATEDEYDKQLPLGESVCDFNDDDLAEADAYLEDGCWEDALEWAIAHHESNDEAVLQKVIECYRACMGQKMPTAFLNLGTLYYTGRGVEQDYKEAYELYKVAADAGEMRAICNCGYCFYYGRHQEVDYSEAFKYFSLAALLFDDANSIYKLGDMYLNGYSVEKNDNYAFIMYTRALRLCQANEKDEACLGDAQFRVGKCLLRGVGTKQNVEDAHALLSFALLNFYKRRKTDIFVDSLIQSAKELIIEAQSLLDQETITG